MPPVDPFSSHVSGLDSPASASFAVTPHDTNSLTVRPRFIHVNVAGDVKYLDEGGADVTLTLAAGWHPIRPLAVRATGTTATGITGHY